MELMINLFSLYKDKLINGKRAHRISHSAKPLLMDTSLCDGTKSGDEEDHINLGSNCSLRDVFF